MLRYLRPAGNKISCATAQANALVWADNYFRWPLKFYASGTAALSAAITASAITASKNGKRGNVRQGKVLLPAYACPDLISAILLAGCQPCLVDLERERPWMDLDMLSSLLDEDTVAIIAINFLGIEERLELIKKQIGGRSIALIEDCAQSFPCEPESETMHADYKIFSFGRGKPVGILGGGAVICRGDVQQAQLPESMKTLMTDFVGTLKYRLKVFLYNILIKPWVYGFPASLPFLHIGETRFKPLHAIEGMDGNILQFLPDNVKRYCMMGNNIESRYRSNFETSKGNVVDLAAECQVPEAQRLLRYPVLLESDGLRDKLMSNNKIKRLGASCLYPSVLPEIQGVAEAGITTSREFPNAQAFASRLLTLPTHQDVSKKDVETLCQAVVCKE